jgi:adenylate kinase
MNLNTKTEKIEAILAWLGTGSLNVFGVPLAGKDTQCSELALILSAKTFGGGDILRNSKTSDTLQSEINNGKLAPKDEYLSLILPYFGREEFTDKPLVLSSVGRWLGEEEAVIQAAAQSNHPIKAAVFLELQPQEAHDRLEVAERDRTDDSKHILETRFDEFDTKTRPVLETYKAKGLLISIDGNQAISDVTDEIIDALYNKAKEQA